MFKKVAHYQDSFIILPFSGTKYCLTMEIGVALSTKASVIIKCARVPFGYRNMASLYYHLGKYIAETVLFSTNQFIYSMYRNHLKNYQESS